MKRFGAILALASQIAGTGCAAHHGRALTPQAPRGTGSTDWSAVSALPRGREVRVTMDGGESYRGWVWCVGDAALTIRNYGGDQALPRDEVARVVARVQTGSKYPRWHSWVGVPIATAVLGGLTGLVVGAVKKDKRIALASWRTFWIAMMIGIPLGKVDYPRPIIEDQLVYVRP